MYSNNSQSKRWRRLLIVGLTVPFSLVACNKSDPLTSATSTTTSATQPATTSPSPTSPPPEPATTTTSATTTTLLPVVTTAPPQPVTAPTAGSPTVPTNDEWVVIIKTLRDRIDLMYTDPPNADIASACAPGSDCEKKKQVQLGDMSNRKEHYQDVPSAQVLSVDNVVDVGAVSNRTIAPGTMYEITCTLQSGDYSKARIVDADGNVVAKVNPTKGTPPIHPATRTLVWYPEDQELPWRFVD